MYGSLYGGQSVVQALNFLQDLKLGQYVKLAPRVTFCMQAAGKQYPQTSVKQPIERRPIGTIVGALLNCQSFSVQLAIGLMLIILLLKTPSRSPSSIRSEMVCCEIISLT